MCRYFPISLTKADTAGPGRCENAASIAIEKSTCGWFDSRIVDNRQSYLMLVVYVVARAGPPTTTRPGERGRQEVPRLANIVASAAGLAAAAVAAAAAAASPRSQSVVVKREKMPRPASLTRPLTSLPHLSRCRRQAPRRRPCQCRRFPPRQEMMDTVTEAIGATWLAQRLSPRRPTAHTIRVYSRRVRAEKARVRGHYRRSRRPFFSCAASSYIDHRLRFYRARGGYITLPGQDRGWVTSSRAGLAAEDLCFCFVPRGC